MVAATIIMYAILLVIFLIISALILRHTVKFSYLSPRFKTVVSIFGLLALIVIIFTLYLVFLLSRPEPSSSGFLVPSTSTAPSSTSTSDINF